jgi:hypothetical protein
MGSAHGQDATDRMMEKCGKLKRQADREFCIKQVIKEAPVAAPVPKLTLQPDPPTLTPETMDFPRVDRTEWNKTITIKTDSFSKDISYLGPEQSEGSTYSQPQYTWRLTGHVDKQTSAETFMISFSDTYQADGWRFWKWADSDKAESLPVIIGNRRAFSCSRGTCLYHEPLGIVVSRGFVERAARDGIWVKLKSTNGAEFTFKINSEDSSRILSAIADCKNTACAGS